MLGSLLLFIAVYNVIVQFLLYKPFLIVDSSEMCKS